MAGSGRTKSSSVWNYFKYDKDAEKTICTVLCSNCSGDSSDAICGKEFNGQYPTNLKKHLKACHPEHYKCFETAEVKRKEKDREKHTSKESKPRQLSLSEKYFPSKQYDCHTKKYQAITLRLATFIGASNVPLNLVDNDEFRELIEELDACYKLPHSKKLGVEIENLYSNVKSKISSSLQNARFISICTDIWSKPGMTASFLGITAHYFSHQDSQRHNVTLAVSRLPSPHTADRILETFDTVMSQWSIPKCKIFRVLTDNGSNMVAAFKNCVLDQINFEDDDYPEQSFINLDPESSNNTVESTNNVHLDEISDSEADSDVEIDSEQDASNEISNFTQ